MGTAGCIHELVREQAARTPDRIALSHDGRSLDYAGLDAASDALAHRLRAAGVVDGEVVAVLLDRSIELIVGLTAVLKAGAAYLYLDPAEPQAQRERILADVGGRVAIVDGSTAALAASLPVAVDVSVRPSPPVPEGSPDVTVTPDSPAYVCYTSGSTGEPKGVVVPHRAVRRLVHHPTWLDVTDDDVFFQLTRVGFDVSTFEIWLPLVRGLRLALGPPLRDDMDFAELMATIRREGVSVLWLTTGLFHKIVTHHLDGLTGLRHLLAGGDVLSPAHVNRVMAAYPELLFTNGYGPTENTTFSTCWTSRSPVDGPRVPIGVPIDESTAVVLDDALRPVPAGVVGDLWVGGAGVATGYLKRPAETAGRFVADPTPGAAPGSRMYRTGDLAREEVDGTLDFLGRADRQVKVRGYRVEPSAVETELLAQPGVEQAAVLTRSHGAGDTRLVAFVAAPGIEESEWPVFGTSLRESLQRTLPVHLVPWAVVVRRHIPLNANGKVDRSALPSDRIPRNVWNEYVAPRDDVERRLAAVWSHALDVETVGVEDNFFDLGGHSLLAAELIAALQAEFGVSLPARTLYLRPTISDLAAEVRSGHERTAEEGVGAAIH